MPDHKSDRKLQLMILCRVVDNYGDIGFVYRLARSISRLAADEFEITLIVSDLLSFSKMAPEISSVSFQMFREWKVYDWNAAELCSRAFTEHKPHIVLECFQCGRPQWLEDILFSPDQKDIVHIINVEYLTAEAYAEDFHLLNSLTRSSSVKKMNFLPGFTKKTGGLVLDEEFLKCRNDRNYAISLVKPYLGEEAEKYFNEREKNFNVVVFSYERNFDPVVKALQKYQDNMTASVENFVLNVFVAEGLSKEGFLNSYRNTEASFNIVELPFMPQENWDALLTLTDFSFIRGEDSLSRSCLAGVPFVWHAYIQDEEYQLVKVHALLHRMKEFFSPEDYSLLSYYWTIYNRNIQTVPGAEAVEILSQKKIPVEPIDPASEDIGEKISVAKEQFAEENSLYEILLNVRDYRSDFEAFSRELIRNGDLAEKLLTLCKSFSENR